jgi:hypothetical protein
MAPYVSRAIALVAVALGLAAIWITAISAGGGSTSYWNIDPGHGVGIALLVMAIVAAAGVVLATILGLRAIDHIWMLAGLPLGGLYLFIPIDAFGQGASSELDTGALLGFTTFFLFVIASALTVVPVRLGTATAAPAAPPPPAPPPAP